MLTTTTTLPIKVFEDEREAMGYTYPNDPKLL